MIFFKRKNKVYDTGCNTYTVLRDGYYLIVTTTWQTFPTGTFETINNPERIWFQFWKPKTITQEIYETREISKTTETKTLKAGDSI